MNVAPLVRRIATLLVASLCVLYVGDFISVKLRHDPTSTVQISTIYAIPQKGSKTDYEPGDPVIETCVNAMFPHLGYNPCWYVNRHRNRQADY